MSSNFQIRLPVFLALQVRESVWYLGWPLRFEVMRLLIRNGASEHELVRNMSITQLILLDSVPHSFKLMEFFNLLLEESYADFDSVGKNSGCAFLSAIMTQTQAMEALDFLVRVGVNFNHILIDGMTVLSFAACLSITPGILEKVCSVAGLEHLNRQNRHGLTPLHYAITCAYKIPCIESYQKIKFLLQNGADLNLKGKYTGIDSWVSPRLKDIYPEFTPYELAKGLDTNLGDRFVHEVELCGRRHELDSMVEVFEDALEEQPEVRVQ
jgi:ankyrin repeat protein